VLTRKSFVIATLSLLALLVGIALDMPLLTITSIPLIAYLFFSFIFSNNNNSKNDLTINRYVDKNRAYEDEPCKVFNEIVNHGPTRIDFLDILDHVPANLAISEGSNHHIVSLGLGEKFSFSYSLKPRMYGFYEIGPVEVKQMDSQATVVATSKIPGSGHIRVLPKIAYVSKFNIRPKRTRNWPGEIVARRVGDGLEFYSLRDYIQGDPVRRINWKAASKYDDRLFTNQFMSELGGDTIIALDARSISEVGVPPESTVAYSIRAAAIIAYRLLRDRNRVGLISLGQSLERVFPGFGRRQFERIQIALSDTKSGETWEIRGLGAFLSTFFSTMVQIVVISSLNDEGSLEAIGDIAGRGFRVLVISPSPTGFEGSLLKRKDIGNETFGLGLRLLNLQRQNRLNELRQYVTVVDWDVKSLLTDALQEATYQWKMQREAQ
jgi:uncharacterized protein (DUF58 family)